MTIGEERDTASLSVTADAAGGDTVVLTVSGEVDYETAPELRAAVLGAIEPHPAGVVLDLAGLRFMDSSGLGVIVGGWQRAQQADVRYVLRRVPPVIAEQFEMTGLDKVFTFADDQDDASAA
ncbi:STAS domain-containing protein [Dactylosporangium vinaceum]|uniref:Anti-sigma factor antagonist n=1 Tax=Dactylosporangium vinaceum TaxID=53362 RepID=A0ABV5M8C8_9ACTN|nr:STAS domain-containing protein [Dactylosporangium vinaceum]UAB94224.1 STAS domain-containing protein [Dactylosporangium vinaceum]